MRAIPRTHESLLIRDFLSQMLNYSSTQVWGWLARTPGFDITALMQGRARAGEVGRAREGGVPQPGPRPGETRTRRRQPHEGVYYRPVVTSPTKKTLAFLGGCIIGSRAAGTQQVGRSNPSLWTNRCVRGSDVPGVTSYRVGSEVASTKV